MMQKSQCEYCLYYDYDEEYERYYCQMNLDEDEVARYTLSGRSGESCPYFRFGDDYTIVRKQN